MIGGKVLDASALAALARRRPAAAALLADLLSHPSVVLGELDAATAEQVDQLLVTANVFDALAAHVAYVARRRGWPALTADPGRLQRVNPDNEHSTWPIPAAGNGEMLSAHHDTQPTWRKAGQCQRRMISFGGRGNAPPPPSTRAWA